MITNRFKRIIFAAILSFSLFLSFSGCGEDPPVIFNDTDTISTLITGSVILHPYVSFSSYITPIYGGDLDIDSVKYGDSSCTLFKNYSQILGNNFQYQSVYNNRADSFNYSSGDNVNIKIFMGDETVVTNLKLLSYYNDIPLLDSSVFNTDVAIGQDINLVWHPVPNADWYGIRVFLNLGGNDYKEYYSYSRSTNFTLTGSYHQTNSNYSVRLSAITGPIPDVDQPNVFSEKITGSLYSTSKTFGISIKIGEGASSVSPKLTESMKIINFNSDEFFNKLIENLQK